MAHILIVEARYYDSISDMLLEGAKAALEKNGQSYEVVSVPGALEIPGAVAFAMENRRYDGYVALGCVIRGETTHYEVVAEQSARGLVDLAIHKGAAVGNGILTVENKEQAEERANPDKKNKGAAAALACLGMVHLKRTLGR